MNERIKIIAAVLLTALAYYVSGWLGLLLAIPPGYATAVWPPSGLALAAIILFGPRAGFGVWLGSFLLNLSTALDAASGAALARSVLLPGFIALGAVAQAYTGAWLIRRTVGYHNILTQEFDVVRMLMLGGPMACVISASVGVTSLWAAGFIPNDVALFNWWNWWIGDTIGVLVFAPLALVWSVRPYRDWFSRQLAVTLPLLATFALVVVVFVLTSSREQLRLHSEFEGRAGETAQRLRAELARYQLALSSVEGFYSSTGALTRDEFQGFAARIMQEMPGLYGIAWDTRVLQAGRADFERAMHAQGYADFKLLEHNAEGQLIPAAQREEYVVVTHMRYNGQPLSSIGYDIASEPIRAGALKLAEYTGHAAASARIQLVGDEAGASSVLMLQPVYRGQVRGAENLLGYAVLALRVSNMMETALDPAKLEGVTLRLFDRSAPASQLYGPPPEELARGTLHHQVPLLVGGREWDLEFVLPADWLVAHRSWQAWLVLAAGLIFTSLLGILLLVMTGRTAKVEQRVTERTTELAEKNAELQRREQAMNQLVDEQRIAQIKMRTTARDLAVSNRELEQFTYIVSHDLQTPLRTMTSYAELLLLRYRAKLDADADEFLQFIEKSARHLQAVVIDLLKLSRVGRVGQASLQLAPLDAAIERACLTLSREIKRSFADIAYDNLPEVRGDHVLLTQMFQNLIGNALKFQPEGNVPRVEISCERRGEDWIITLTDNGIGIPDDQHDNLFTVFRRLHLGGEYEGTGIGLATCRKIAQYHGGDIHSVPHTGGARFVIRLPVNPAERAAV